MASKDIEEAFKMFDKDGDGQITAKELVNVMKILGKPATFEEAKAMIKQVDKTGTGTIEMKEFVKMMGSRLEQPLTKEELKDLFEAFDKDKNGFIDKDEVKKTMQQVGLDLTDKDVEEMLKVVGVKNANKIYFKDFEKLMKKMLKNESSKNNHSSSLNDDNLTENYCGVKT